MKLLSRIQPVEFLGVQHTQLIMCEIPGHTAGNHVTITCNLDFVLKFARIWHDFCAHADLLSNQNAHMVTSLTLQGATWPTAKKKV